MIYFVYLFLLDLKGCSGYRKPKHSSETRSSTETHGNGKYSHLIARCATQYVLDHRHQKSLLPAQSLTQLAIIPLRFWFPKQHFTLPSRRTHINLGVFRCLALLATPIRPHISNTIHLHPSYLVILTREMNIHSRRRADRQTPLDTRGSSGCSRLMCRNRRRRDQRRNCCFVR